MAPQIAPAQCAPTEEIRRKHRTGLVTLLFTDIVDSTALKQQLGDRAGATIFEQHHRIVRETLAQFAEGREIETAGDSFLITFATPSDAVQFALLLQPRLRILKKESGVAVLDRVGIHVGEVVIKEDQASAKPRDLYGIQIDTCARVMALAQAGQILMTRSVFDSARQVLKAPDVAPFKELNELQGESQLEWLNHGAYLLKGLEGPLEICEAREIGQRTSPPPTSSEKAQRQVSAGEEQVLGWRPAVGQAVPDVLNTRWRLEKKLGEGGFGEVWLGRNPTTKEARVFKFCFQVERVRFLKRELTLFRVLKERVGDHPNIVRLHDVYLEQPPFYVEMDYVEGSDLRTWSEEHGRDGMLPSQSSGTATREPSQKERGWVDQIPLEVRLEIVAQAAEGLQAAHDAGVIHRDVKPSNILVESRGSRVERESVNAKQATDDGRTANLKSEVENPKVPFEPSTLDARRSTLCVKLTDFGIGQVVSPEALGGITRAGFTQTVIGSGSSQTGTQLYMAPELLAGKPASARSDIYSLGVVLYQLLVGDFTRPVTTDWANDTSDPLLRDDLQHCFAGNPQERFAGAGQLAKNLRALPARQRALANQQAELAAREKAAYRRGLIRTASLAAVVVMTAVFLAAIAWYQSRLATKQAHRAEAEELNKSRLLYAAEMNLAQQALELDHTGRAVDLLERHRPRAGHEDPRGFEWRYLWRSSQGDSQFTFRVHATNSATALAFSPDGKTLAIGGAPAVQLWNVTSRRRAGTLEGHRQPVRSLAFSPDGRILASEDAESSVILWDVGTQRSLTTFQGDGSGGENALIFFPNGKILATARGQTVKLWDIAAARELPSLKGHDSQIICLAISADGKMLAVGELSGLVRLWDLELERSVGTLPAHFGRIISMAFSPDSKMLAAASFGNEVKLWDVKTRTLVDSLFHRGPMTWVAFSRDGQFLATASDDQTAKLWDLATRKLVRTLSGHTKEVKSVAFSPDGQSLATGSADGTVRLWSAAPKKEENILRGHDDAVLALAFSTDGQTLATGSKDGVIKLWNVTTEQQIASFPGHTNWIFAVAFSPDGKTLASGSGQWYRGDIPGELKLWEIATRREVANLSGHGGCIFSIDFSPDGKILITGSNDQTLRLWDVAKRVELTTLRADALKPDWKTSWKNFGVLSPDGKTLVSSSVGKSLNLWEVPSGKHLATLKRDRGVLCAGFSPDGRLLATGSLTIQLWDVARRKQVATLAGHRAGIECVAFSPDGRTLASGGIEGTIKLWNTITGHEVLTLRGHLNSVSSVAFSPDGNILASTSLDKTVRLWRATPVEETGAGETSSGRAK